MTTIQKLKPRKTIIFDIDDTLWGLNAKILEHLNFTQDKLVTFSATENPLLTMDEKQQLINGYCNPDSFESIQWYNGIKRIPNLEQLGAKIYINSNSASNDIIKLKEKQIKSVLKLPDDRFQFNLIGIHQAKDKQILENAYIFIDDSPHNILTSTATYNIMLNQPWNTSDQAKTILKNKAIIRCDSLNQIIDTIIHLLTTT